MRALILFAAAIFVCLNVSACGMVIGTTGYWEQFNQSLKEANTEQHPGDSQITANIK